MPSPRDELKHVLTSAIAASRLLSAVFSGPADSHSTIRRIDVRPVTVRGVQLLQLTSRSSTQAFHQNLTVAQAITELDRLLDEFRNVRGTNGSSQFVAYRTHSDQWKLRIEEASEQTAERQEQAHDRHRNYLVPDGTPCPFLMETGIMTTAGQVRASHYRKFRQINRFLEFINDVADELPADRTLHVVDFGCGKSYLTFATHYFLTQILGRDVQVTGLDRRSDVVSTCSDIARRLGLQNLRFSVSDISDWAPGHEVDLVISLHACDTATDLALLQAVRWKSRVILTVPCCQHELNKRLQAPAFPPITTYGLMKDRLASLATDSMRASLLCAIGYPTQVLEFIDMEHTPKNILLRSVCRQSPDQADVAAEALRDVRRLRTVLGIAPLALERGLIEEGLLTLDSPAESLPRSIAREAMS